MKVYSPNMHKFYQAAFDDIAKWNLEGFADKYRFLDLNIPVSYQDPLDQNSIRDDSIINALINIITLSVVDKNYRNQLIELLNHLMAEKEIDFTKRDKNGKTPLNNFLSTLQTSTYFFKDAFSIPYFSMLTKYFELYCNMINYCKEQNYDEALLIHPEYRIVTDITPTNNVWNYFRRIPEPNKRDLTQAEVFENFLKDFRINEEFFLNYTSSLLSEELREKAKGQIYRLDKLENGKYNVTCLLERHELEEFKEIRVEIREGRRHPTLAPLQTKLRRSSDPAIFLGGISPKRLSERRSSSPNVLNLDAELGELPIAQYSDKETAETIESVKFEINITEDNDLNSNLEYSESAYRQDNTKIEEEMTKDLPENNELKDEIKPEEIQIEKDNLDLTEKSKNEVKETKLSLKEKAIEKLKSLEKKLQDNLPTIKAYAIKMGIILLYTLGAACALTAVYLAGRKFAPETTLKAEGFVKNCTKGITNMASSKYWQNLISKTTSMSRSQ